MTTLIASNTLQCDKDVIQAVRPVVHSGQHQHEYTVFPQKNCKNNSTKPVLH